MVAMKRLLLLFLMLITISGASQTNWFSSYPTGTPQVNGDLDLYCGESYARILLAEAYGAHIIRFGVIYCSDDCGGYLPIDSPFTEQVEWLNPLDVNSSNQVSMPIALVENVRYWYQGFIETADGIFYSSSTGQQLSPTCSGTPPTVVSCTSVSNIGVTSATTCGQVTSEGSSSVTTYGICYGTDSNPTISMSTVAVAGSLSNFTANLTSLDGNTKYYYRAYAVNSDGVGYGGTYNFTTLSQYQPDITTNLISSITQTSAVSGGHINSDGNGDIIKKGVCWNTTGSPTLSDSHTDDGTGLSDFVSNLTGLSSNTTYYVRAYAKNSNDYSWGTLYATGYGQEETFTTAGTTCSLPTFTAASCGNPTANSIDVTALIDSDGGCSVTSRGFQYGTDSSFATILGSITVGSGTGQYGATISGLTCGTTYYFRPWATNPSGTYYANSLIGGGCTTETNNYPTFTTWHTISTSSCPNGTYTFSSTQVLFDQAWADIKAGCVSGLSGDGKKISDSTPEGIVGKQIYQYNSCELLSRTGYYLYEYPYSGNIPPNGNTWYRLYISNGVVQSITQLY